MAVAELDSLGGFEPLIFMSAPDKPKKPDLTKYGSYTISTSSDHGKDGTYGIAYCPICGRSEESHDHGYGAEHGILVSLGKIRTHLKRDHGVEDEPAA